MSDLDLDAVPGRFAMIVIGSPKAGRAPVPEHWQSELVYAAVLGGSLPAVPVRPVLVGAPPPSTPLHVRDQFDAYEREFPDRKVWLLGLPLSGVDVVDVRTDYIEIAPELTRGRSSSQLGDDPAWLVMLTSIIDVRFPGAASMAAVVITEPRGLTHDLPAVPTDDARRRELADRLATGRIGAVVAMAVGRVVPPS